MMKTSFVFVLTCVCISNALNLFPPTLTDNPAMKEEPTTCVSLSIKADLGDMRDKVMDILAILDRIEAKQSELTSLTDSYENLNEKYDILLDAVNRLLSQECKVDSPTGSSAPEAVNPCIRSCEGLANGDYQSCIGCSMFVTCSNGYMYDERPCASSIAGQPPLVWDDNKKRCEHVSETCDESTVDSPTGSSAPEAVNPCIQSCEGLANGDYQSCIGCSVFVTCSNGYMHDERPCASSIAGQPPLVWDDNKKRCEHVSETCDESTVDPPTK